MNLETVTKVRNSQGEDREKQRPGCRENGSGKERARSQRLCKLLASAPSERGNRDRPLSFTPGRSHRMLHVRPEASKGCVLSLDFFGKQAKGQPVAIVTTAITPQSPPLPPWAGGEMLSRPTTEGDAPLSHSRQQHRTKTPRLPQSTAVTICIRDKFTAGREPPAEHTGPRSPHTLHCSRPSPEKVSPSVLRFFGTGSKIHPCSHGSQLAANG
ncbi:unnamed protein product [Rangifer tarandus platyrhynchus]|uniref:Uncharacterized protein n=1 Tax=Rangifer tarandus platyrhynchus TaxID=3082113 RepID=A0AC59ZKU9_RANTA